MIGARSRYLAFSVCRLQSEKSWGSRRCFGVCGKHVGGAWNAARPCRSSFVVRAIKALFFVAFYFRRIRNRRIPCGTRALDKGQFR
jgi:hypothetical protein